MTNEQVTQALNEYKKKYEGKYWQTGATDTNLSASNWRVGNAPWPGHDNKYGDAYQCYGFSLFLTWVLFKKRIIYSQVHNKPNKTNLGNGWILYRNDYASFTLEPGDIIRGNNDGHSAVVWKIENGKVYVVECWGSYNSILKWGGWNGGSPKTVQQM